MPRPVLVYTDTPVLAPTDPLVARYLQSLILFDRYKHRDSPAVAAGIADAIKALPPGRRAVYPYYILSFQMKPREYPVDLVGIYERGEIDTGPDVRAFGHLGAALAARGVALDDIYCDNEDDLTPWGMGLEAIQKMYKSEAARARMPPELLDFDVDKLVFLTPEYHRWLAVFNVHAQRIKVASLRKVLIDSNLMAPWGERTRAVNFGAIRTSFRVHDLNGWENDWDALLDGRTSCPVCMPVGDGHRYRGREHHILWNSLVDLLNAARSSAATSGLFPVIREALRTPDNALWPAGEWFLEQLIGHLVRTGADRFMMHHVNARVEDERSLAAIMQRHEPALPDRNPVLPELPLDVDEIVTGDWRTTYAEFLRRGMGA